MAAEHLTKKKLIQLLAVLFVLIVAFTLRTCNYQKSNTNNMSEKHVASSEKLTTTDSMGEINKKEAKNEVKKNE